MFRTYKNLHKSTDPKERLLDRNPDMAHDIPIWQVARATSAAPTYFKPPVIDGLEYVDGGFGANNPCAEIYEEVRRMNNNSRRCVSIILSIGTGKNNEARRFKGTGFQRYLNYANFARKWASDSEKTHEAMLKAKSEVHFNYFRLNVEEGLDHMKLDEWRARGPVRTKIGERVGNLRSCLTKDRRNGSKAIDVTNGKEANVLKENFRNLPNGNGTVHTNGNGSMDHARQQASFEPNEQNNDRKYVLSDSQRLRISGNSASSDEKGLKAAMLSDGRQATLKDATANTSTAHMESLVEEATTLTFNQPNGHLPTTATPARKLDRNTDDTNIPKWFRHKNRTLESIRQYTEAYLSHPDTIEMIEQCAKLLVDGRRGRAKCDPQRWEKACFGTWYQCRVPECPRGEKEYEKRRQLRTHLLDKHKGEFTRGAEGKSKLEDALDSCKIVVH